MNDASNNSDIIKLRDWVELQIKHERELRKLASDDTARALMLQAEEYQRRLDVLNHAQERLDRVISNGVQREAFETYIRTMAEWRDNVNRAIDEQRGASNKQMWLIGLVVTFISISLRYLP